MPDEVSARVCSKHVEKSFEAYKTHGICCAFFFFLICQCVGPEEYIKTDGFYSFLLQMAGILAWDKRPVPNSSWHWTLIILLVSGCHKQCFMAGLALA